MFGIFRGIWPAKTTPGPKPGSLGVIYDPKLHPKPVIEEVHREFPKSFAGQIAAVGVQTREEFEEAKAKAAQGNLSVRWIAPFLDGSGYAEAGRNYVAALSTVGVEVIARPVSFEEVRSDHGRSWNFVKPAMARKGGYIANVVFLTPDHFQFFKDPYAFNVGIFDWETDRLPREWVEECNQMDEIWVPCSWTSEVARSSGVRTPICVFGHCSSADDYGDGPTLSIPEADPSWYKFYSIFQWTERKNPKGLIQAYFKAFTNRDPVILILKTYRCNYSEEEQAIVVSEIEKIKNEVGGSRQPRILAILGLMTKDQIMALHRSCDCFVLFHRAEGWGLPHADACMMGKPVITTGYGGNLEFTTKDNSYLIRHKLVSVEGMSWIHWYRPEMSWADPDISQGAKFMRRVFSRREEAAEKAAMAKKLVRSTFSWEAIGGRMKARIADFTRMKV